MSPRKKQTTVFAVRLDDNSTAAQIWSLVKIGFILVALPAFLIGGCQYYGCQQERPARDAAACFMKR